MARRAAPTVFVNYRHSDTGDAIPALLPALEQRVGDVRVFVDRERIEAGARWAERIRSEVAACSVFLALIGKDWLHARNEESGQRRMDDPSDWIRIEIELALARAATGELKIIPVLVGDDPPPKREYLPESMQALLDHQACRLRMSPAREFDSSLEALLAQVADGTTPAVRAEPWLAALLSRRIAGFEEHVQQSFRQGTGALLELLVLERDVRSDPEQRPDESTAPPRSPMPLDAAVHGQEAPVILLGEGGAGKTTALLRLAAEAARRAQLDPTSPVPVYVNLALLQAISDVTDLQAIVADAAGTTWSDLASFGVRDRAGLFFVFDSLNEMPEQQQHACVVALQRFIGAQGGRHRYVIGARRTPSIERLAKGLPSSKTFEILRLEPDQVRSLLSGLGFEAIYDSMSRELRDLAGNPFMLVAFTRTLAGQRGGALPRNRGSLYRRFVTEWMRNEDAKRTPGYSYERFKQPILAYLATSMTARGETALRRNSDLEEELVTRLESIEKALHRRTGMPPGWTVDECVDELLKDGLLRETAGRLHFMHHSVQEYFTAVHFCQTSPEALIAFTPKFAVEQVSTSEFAELPDHRLVPVLLMVMGLVDDSTELIRALLPRNPLLAAASIASANSASLHAWKDAEEAWYSGLSGAESDRALALSCFVHVGCSSSRFIKAIARMVVRGSWFTGCALAVNRLSLQLPVGREIIANALELPEDEVEMHISDLGSALIEVGAYERAASTSAEAVAGNPQDADVHALRAWSCYKAGWGADALESATRAHDLDPVHGYAAWVLALACMRGGDLARARATIEHLERVSEFLGAPGSSCDASFLDELAAMRDREELRDLVVAAKRLLAPGGVPRL